MPKRLYPKEVNESLTFPLAGMDQRRANLMQERLTSVYAENVVVYDATERRARGGSRSGLTKYHPDVVVSKNPIQEIAHLVTNDSVISQSYGLALYAQAVDNGFGLIDETVTSYATVAGTTGYKFICSCWDGENNAYVAEVNETTGGTIIRKLDSNGNVLWTDTSRIVRTGTDRNVCGMTVIENFLYVAVTVSSTVGAIFRFDTKTGSITAYQSTGTVSTLKFSPSSVNCLAGVGKLLGVECGNASSVSRFQIYDTEIVGRKALKVNLAHTGTKGFQRSKVVSDGISAYYVIPSTTANMVRKITTGGVVAWSSSAADTPTAIAYDFDANCLVATRATTKSVMRLSAADGSMIAEEDSGSITAWSDVDSDGRGVFTLWRDGESSNDVMSVNQSLVQVVAPTTIADATHSGASVNKGPNPSNFLQGASRSIRGFVFNAGECRRFDRSDGYTAVTNGNSFNPAATAIFTAQQGTSLYIVDGSIYRRYRSSTDSIVAWTTTAGELPVDANETPARLIVPWRNRIGLAGLVRDPSSAYFSAIGDPLDYEYEPETPSADDAFFFTIHDFINTMVPFTDDILLIGGDHTVWQMTGDPVAALGQLDLLTDAMGMAWGRPWCKDQYGALYFISSFGCVYRFSAEGFKHISEPIEERLRAIDKSTHLFRMAWHAGLQQLYIFVTPYDPTIAAEHYLWDARTGAWQLLTFGAKQYNPFAVHVFDGDNPNDRVLLLGGRDGYMRFVDPDATADDSVPITSRVTIGPITTKQLDEFLIRDFQATMGDTSGVVSYAIHVGDTPEAALAAVAAASGVLGAGRNRPKSVRRSGKAAFIKLESTERWAMELILVSLIGQGRVRRRHTA